MADTSKKYLDIAVLNYSISQLGAKINDTFLQQKALVPNAPGDAKTFLTKLQVGEDVYEIETPEDPDEFMQEISEKEIDDLLFAVFGD